jgi:hypothetical protein
MLILLIRSGMGDIAPSVCAYWASGRQILPSGTIGSGPVAERKRATRVLAARVKSLVKN